MAKGCSAAGRPGWRWPAAGAGGSSQLNPWVRLAPLAPRQGAGRERDCTSATSLKEWDTAGHETGGFPNSSRTLFIWAGAACAVSRGYSAASCSRSEPPVKRLCLLSTDVKTSSGKEVFLQGEQANKTHSKDALQSEGLRLLPQHGTGVCAEVLQRGETQAATGS